MLNLLQDYYRSKFSLPLPSKSLEKHEMVLPKTCPRCVASMAQGYSPSAQRKPVFQYRLLRFPNIEAGQDFAVLRP